MAKRTATTQKKYLNKVGRWVHFQHRDTMRQRMPHPSARLAAAVVPATTIPVDCTGNGTVLLPMDGNDTLGDCMEAMACHVDNIWTFGRGEAGWTESSFALSALESQYESASGGDNGLDEPTLLTKCWAPGLAGQAAATYDDSLDVDVTNVQLTQYLIDQFFHVCMMWSVPDDFLNGFSPGGVWAEADTPDPNNGHGTPLTDIGGPNDTVGGVNISGFYRLVTWGAWVWVSPAFVASVDPACFVVFSRRQFNAAGYDAHGRHVSTQAAAWVALGGNPAKAAIVEAMFPGVGPSPSPSPTSPVFANFHTAADHERGAHVTLTIDGKTQKSELVANMPAGNYAIVSASAVAARGRQKTNPTE
jgi:hypothetical protein